MLDIKQALVFSFIVLLVGIVVGFIIGQIFKSDLPSVCKKWNKHHVMEISLLITGFISYLVFTILFPKG